MSVSGRAGFASVVLTFWNGDDAPNEIGFTGRMKNARTAGTRDVQRRECFVNQAFFDFSRTRQVRQGTSRTMLSPRAVGREG